MKYIIKLMLGILIATTIHAQQIAPGWAQNTLQKLSLDEKIGQLFVVNAFSNPKINGSWTTEEPWNGSRERVENLITKYHVGGILWLGTGIAKDQIRLNNHFQSLSKIPLLVTQDCEWGLTMRLPEAIRFPRNMTLGALSEHDNELIYKMGYEVGTQCKALGVHVNFAPVVDVNNNPANPVIGDRSFGDNPDNVAKKATYFMHGLQAAGIIACAKHFPGHGDTDVDSHYDLPIINHSKERLEAIELRPFKALIDEGVRSVMTAHLEVPTLGTKPGQPASLHHETVTTLLREKMDFKGLIVTDALCMQGATKHNQPGELELKALLAGNDILLSPPHVEKAVICIKEALEQGLLTAKTLDEHVLRILLAKEWAFGQLGSHKVPTQHTLEKLHTAKAYILKKMLYTKAITQVRDPKKALPLATAQPQTLIQVGSLRGTPLEHKLNKQLHKLQVYHLDEKASEADITSVLEQTKDETTIVIALHQVDYKDKITYGIDQKIYDMIKMLTSQGKKVIITLFGSPYIIKNFDAENTIIAAYENDIDAQEATVDVLLGAQAEGTLPISPL